MPARNGQPQQVGRWWILTLSCADYPDTPALAADAVYAKGQQERGAGGFLHWQIVVCFQANKRRSGVVERYPGAHAELTRSPAALAYVWKEDTRVEGSQFEHGTPPFKRNNKVDWAKQLELAKGGRLGEMEPGVVIRNFSAISKIAAAHYVPVMRDQPVVKVFWGVTGSGKSHTAMHQATQTDNGSFANVYYKAGSNKWWDGYRGQTKVVIEEFDGCIGITHLLKWFDKYPCGVEVKGGCEPLLATEFWVTSNVSPDEWWGRQEGKKPTEEQLAALRRRIQVTHFERRWVPTAE